MMRHGRSKGMTPKKTPGKLKLNNAEPFVVFCRIRPLYGNDQVCIKPKPSDSKTIILYSPEEPLTSKVMEYSFTKVFGEETTQKQLFDHVALPLIEDLLVNDNNGLLFTYGVTSSGKTYTMTGSPRDCGLLPRTLEVIFNSISEYQAQKFVFKPDRMNGFDIQPLRDALMDQQNEMGVITTPKNRSRRNQNEWRNRVVETAVVKNVSTDVKYAIFVSYVEIYNNYVYDLLDDSMMDVKKPRPSKSIAKDYASNNMYISGVNESEVKNVEDALELFNKGQLRRKVSNTALNTESSRSHSVFTIRVVRAPLEYDGKEIVQDSEQISVSQLSLVDLAGSERQVRTGNTKHKLREAGCINNSLSTLRRCIEILRETQNKGIKQTIPYRDSALTKLFNTFFEGSGKMRMVVCVNPRAEDYDENIHVMNFAEKANEIKISRYTPVSTPTTPGFRTGRGRLYREALQRAKDQGVPVAEILQPIVYSLPEFPQSLLEDEDSFESLLEFIAAREVRRNNFLQDLERREAEFRNNLIAVDRENIQLQNERTILIKDLNAREAQVLNLENKLASYEERINSSDDKISHLERRLIDSQNEVEEKNDLLMQQNREVEEIRTQMQEKLALEKDKMRRIMERRLAEKQAELEGKLCFNGEKFRLLREILNAGDWDYLIDLNCPPVPGSSTNPSELTVPKTRPRRSSYTDTASSSTEVKMPKSRSTVEFVGLPQNQRTTPDKHSNNDFDQLFAKENKPPSSSQRSIAIANLRHRRSRSSSGDVWVEHKPIGNLELNTVLQPTMKKRKSVTKLKVKDVTNKDASKYVLEHQEQDSQGEVETQLYKGDIIPSAGGGAQIVFSDVEKLRQESPPSTQYNLRKRSSDGLPLREIEDRCAVSVECHGLPSKVSKKK